jgi:hypothetical protein
VTGGISYAVENGFRTLTKEGMIQMRNLASEEQNTQALKPASQILNVPRPFMVTLVNETP